MKRRVIWAVLIAVLGLLMAFGQKIVPYSLLVTTGITVVLMIVARWLSGGRFPGETGFPRGGTLPGRGADRPVDGGGPVWVCLWAMGDDPAGDSQPDDSRVCGGHSGRSGRRVLCRFVWAAAGQRRGFLFPAAFILSKTRCFCACCFYRCLLNFPLRRATPAILWIWCRRA